MRPEALAAMIIALLLCFGGFALSLYFHYREGR